MSQITVTVPPQFLPLLDELVLQTGSGSREQYLKNVLRDILFKYKVSKDLAPEQQKRVHYLMGLWP